MKDSKGILQNIQVKGTPYIFLLFSKNLVTIIIFACRLLLFSHPLTQAAQHVGFYQFQKIIQCKNCYLSFNILRIQPGKEIFSAISLQHNVS